MATHENENRAGGRAAQGGRLRVSVWALGAKALPFLALGAVASVAVASILCMGIDPTVGVQESASSYGADGVWTVTRTRTWGSEFVQSHRIRKRDWGPEQACGAPDTPVAG